MNNFVDFFIPSQLAEDDGVDRRRASIAIKTSFVLAICGPLMAIFSYLRAGSLPVFGAVMLVSVVIASAPLLLRRTANLSLVGNVILLPLFLLCLAIASLTGGHMGPTTSWMLVLPILAMLFHGSRAAWFWCVLVLVSWLAFFGIDAAGYPFEQRLGTNLQELRRLIEMVLLLAVVFTIFLLKDGLQSWLVQTLREREAETRAVLETAPDGILTITLDGEICTTNEAAAHIFGRSPHQIIGHDIKEFVSTLPVDQLKAAPKLFTAFGTTQEHQGTRPEGTFPLEVAFGALSSDNAEEQVEKLVLVLRDIAERKEHELALQRARDEAIEASRAKSSFLANMSHELRTPLNAIIGYSEMMLEELEFQNSPHSGRELFQHFVPDLGRIRKAGKHLLAIINDILDLSKIEAGKMTIHAEIFDVRELLDDIIGTVRPLAQKNENQMELLIDEDLRFMTSDLTKIRQILFNLLSNACKFTSNGTVRLRATSEQDQLLFSVEDTGIGMSQDQLEKIFDAFVQADSSTTRQFGGTGLGLTITRHFCQLLGGELDVVSVSGEGTTFTVRVAADLNDPGTLLDTGSDEKFSRVIAVDAASSSTVLVVDDDPIVRDLLRRMLELEGFTVVTAASGTEGLAMAAEFDLCAITLDVMMPSMDGWTLLTRLKEDPRLASIPVIMVTMVSEAARGYALGADHYLVKPVDRKALVKLLSAYRTTAPTPGLALVVEDDEATREILRRTMEGSGWQVCEASDGQEGLAALEQFRPDVVLLDLMMPRVDGFEFLRRFRQNPDLDDVPVVVITAKELSAEEKTFLNSSVNEILTKGSLDRDRLLEDVRRLVARLTSRQSPSSPSTQSPVETPEPAKSQ